MQDMTLSVLIAERDAISRETLEDYFLENHFDVATAGDGIDCLAKFHNGGCDALVLDWDLLWGGGAGVLQCLRAIAANRDMPAVVVLGKDARETLYRESGVPHSCCFTRPVAPMQLIQAVKLAVTMRNVQLT